MFILDREEQQIGLNLALSPSVDSNQAVTETTKVERFCFESNIVFTFGVILMLFGALFVVIFQQIFNLFSYNKKSKLSYPDK